MNTRVEDSDADVEVAASSEARDQNLLPKITQGDGDGTAAVEFVRFVHIPADGSEMFDQGVGEPAARPAHVKLATAAGPAAASPVQGTRRSSEEGTAMQFPSPRNAVGRQSSSPAIALKPASPAASPPYQVGNAASICAPGDAFQSAALISAAQRMRVWTLDALSEEQGLSSAQFRKAYLSTLHLRSKLDPDASSLTPRSAPTPNTGAGAVEWAFALGADAMRLVSVDGKHVPVTHSSRAVSATATGLADGRDFQNARAGVSAFLTNLISDENPAKQDALLEGCLLSLCSLPGRRLLLRLLREAKKERSRTAGSSSTSADPTPTTISKKGDKEQKTTLHKVYRLDLVDEDGTAEHPASKVSSSLRAFPLNYSAFEALTICFLEILQHCTRTEDYTTAYDLLEVGGLYFLFSGDAAEAVAGRAPFLSSQIYHHPIYQAARLWLAELRRRIQALPMPGAATMSQFDAEVVLETRGVLTIMCDIDVNFERATAFIQAVASDYGLGLPVYYELARFMRQLYGRIEDEDGSNALFADDVAYSEHSGESGTATRDTSLHASSHGGGSDVHTSTHSQAEEDEDVLNAMAENIVNAPHLRQRRASLVGYMQIKQELGMGDA